MRLVVLGAVHEELDLAHEVLKAGDGPQQVLDGGDAHPARARRSAHGLGGGLFQRRVLQAGLQADRGGVLRIQPFQHRGEAVRFQVVHVAGNHIQNHQPVLKLEGERGVPAFAVHHFGHVFLRRHLAGDFGVAGDAAAGEQPLEAALPDQLLARLVEQRADALMARLRVHAHVGAIEGLAERVVGIERAIPGDRRPVGGLRRNRPSR